MEYLDRLKRWLQHWLLHQRFYRPLKMDQPLSLRTAKQILLVAAPANQSDLEAVSRFHKALTEAGHQVTLAIVQAEASLHEFPVLDGAYVLDRHNLNWLDLPQKALHQSLTNSSYDVALNLAWPDIFLAHYLMAVSHTSFRMAFYSPAYAYIYDFMVAEPEDGSVAAGIATFEMYLATVQKH